MSILREIDVFISYRNVDLKKAEKLAERLTNDFKLNVWYDQKIPVGANWRKEINEVLVRSKAVIVLWSKSTLESKWVEAEVHRAY